MREKETPIKQKGRQQAKAILKTVREKNLGGRPPGTARSGITIKQEAFAQIYARTGSPIKAYMEVYKPNIDISTKKGKNAVAARAFRVANAPGVTERTHELRRQIAAANVVTVETLVDELAVAGEMAKELRQPAAIVQIVLAKAKLLGMLVDKVEQKSVQFVVHAPPPSPDTATWIAELPAPPDDDDLKLIN